MKTLIFGMILFLAICPTVFGQTATNNCPKITVTGPMGITNSGDTMTFTANVLSSVRLGQLRYAWTVSTGNILRGQGTPSIDVSTDRAVATYNLKATVKLAGIPNGCFDSVSDEVTVRGNDHLPEPLDEFGRLAEDDVRARIDNLYIRLNANPGLEGFIVVSFNRNDTRQEKLFYLKKLHSDCLP